MMMVITMTIMTIMKIMKMKIRLTMQIMRKKKIKQRPTTYCLESPSRDDDENYDDGWDGIDFGYGRVMMMVKGMKMKMTMTMAMTTVLTGETNNKTDAKEFF